MQGINTVIAICLLLCTLSRVSCYMVLQFNDLNKIQVRKLLDAVTDNKVIDEKEFKNILHDKLSKQDARKSVDIPDFECKKLVKRIVPHGFGIKDFEFDEKFKTLYKPLLRIHKRKPNSDDSDDVEDRFDLIYIVNDKIIVDAALNCNLDKDDSLLQPFAIDDTQIKYFPKENENEYFINKNAEHFDNYNSPNKQFSEFGQSRYKLVGGKDKMKAKNTPNEVLHFYLDDKLEQIIGEPKERWIPYGQQSNTNIYDLINKIANYEMVKPKTELEKPERFVPVEQFLSKQFLNHPNIYKENPVHTYQDSNKYKNKNYLNILDQLNQRSQKQTKVKNGNSNEQQSLGWFGPIGTMNSKQLIKSKGYDDHENSNEYHYDELRQQPVKDNKLLDSFRYILQNQKRQIEPYNDDETRDSKSVQDDTRGFFGSIGHTNSKHIMHDKDMFETQMKPFYYTAMKDIKHKTEPGKGKVKSNKFSLLDQDLQASIDNGRDKLKGKPFNLEDLRMHLKSGEEDEGYQLLKEQFEYHDDDSFKTHVTIKPKHPFWNTWTYDKQIVIDDCPGKLVQSGRVCISAFA